jgi:DNA-binding NarL/FixJ family response regulator
MSEQRPRILLADNHPVILAGLRQLLEPKFEAVEMEADGPALLAAAERLRPDLVITDIAMSGFDGVEAIRRLQASFPQMKVLILSIHIQPSYVNAAFDAGACGYVPKTSPLEEVEFAVQEVLAGHFYVSPVVARAAIHPRYALSHGPATGDRHRAVQPRWMLA